MKDIDLDKIAMSGKPDNISDKDWTDPKKWRDADIIIPPDLDKIAMDIIVDLNALKRLLGHHTMGGVRSALGRIRESAEKLQDRDKWVEMIIEVK